MKTKIIELLKAYKIYANILNFLNVKYLPEYYKGIKYIIKIVNSAKLFYYYIYKYLKKKLRTIKK